MIIYIFSIILGLGLSALLAFQSPSLHLIWQIPLIILGCVIGVFILFVIAVCIISLTIDKKKQYDRPTPFYMNLINLAYSYGGAMLGARIRVEGLEKLPEERFLVVSNHLSLFDPLLVTLALKKTWLVFVSKPENFNIPAIGRYMHRCRHLAIDRDDARKAVATINEAAELISGDVVSVGIFPEGTRSKTGQLGEMKAGSFKIAQKARCPIVVAQIEGTDKLKKHFFIIPTVCRFRILAVIPADRVKAAKTVQLAEEVTDMILTAQGRITSP
ncbi:MAG: 1-acyl-sn-glycerol-3-phosphate acyltransferase [Oscillospiraceae bacterium]|nr:1-acyl-sn-glycerol-3-phosphate acyltransferase [Oscillospiraceae bacterium]